MFNTPENQRFFRDMNKHRAGRIDSRVVNTWMEKYREMLLYNYNLFSYRLMEHQQSSPKDVKILRESPEAVEIAVDTIIGWLNSPVGRTFIEEAFGVELKKYDKNGDEVSE